MASTRDEPQQQPLHILFLPYFAPGHLLPVADMAALFAARGATCTILTTPVNADIIRPAVDRANDANLDVADSQKVVISVLPFPDVGLPPGMENMKSITPSHGVAYIVKFVHAAQLLREPFDLFLATSRPRVDAVVTDSFFAWSADAAAAHGVPRLVFLGSSVFARSCSESMLRNNPLETTANGRDDPDALVALPGLPHRVELRRSQMLDPETRPEEWAFYQSSNAADERSFGEVFNSFHELEPDYVEHFHKTLGRRAWLVGPVALASTDMPVAVESSGCLPWLNTKPVGSVVYVSFGTLTSFSIAERREIARGLALSGKNFVWVLGGSDDDDPPEWTAEGFAELTGNNNRGFLVRGWAPQTVILNQPALGGFVTHCGWNSVVEAVSAGVPMVTWPRYADQFHNEKLVVEVLKVGVSLGAKDYASAMETHVVIPGEVIAGSIKRLMGDSLESNSIRNKSKELGVKARITVEKGGSSYDDIGRLMGELMAGRSAVKH
ncbi:anthocyanin 3'-O-beta-glucosyltransferase [Lolium perenne]|uniref:anthocyanin 3'-O-beta-glucosyltransferase n=1 Tax=Lolium perenne TaxID=4522 RepID=UPI0021EA2FEE|nr:anthocyanin 3'-O-beta-glucosyltransferase-like [Lolium perenne]